MLLETRKAIAEEVEKLKKLITSECIVDVDETMDENTVKLMMSALRLMNLYNHDLIEEAELLTQIDSKLDKLLNERKES